MRSLILCSIAFAGVSICWAQTANPVLLGAGNLSPFPFPVAPGQLLTLFVQPGGAISPVTAYTISVVFSNGSDQPMPVFEVTQANTGCAAPLSAQCPEVLAVTVQVPFGIQVICPLCERPVVSTPSIAVSVNGVKTPTVTVQPLQDQVHFLTVCDVIIAGVNSFAPASGGLPCTPIVTHSDGTPVSAILPAMAGEELVAYATGLGETNPALTTGQPAAESSPTVTTFGIDFNYRANALATKPGAAGVPTASPLTASPLFTGATKGYVGLYQINFIVPPPPAGLPPCVDFAALPTYGNAVQSNLTVSVGSSFSFDGAGICVLPSGTAEPLSGDFAVLQ
jgi:uncharacterized protein (TIGR03437 family)